MTLECMYAKDELRMKIRKNLEPDNTDRKAVDSAKRTLKGLVNTNALNSLKD